MEEQLTIRSTTTAATTETDEGVWLRWLPLTAIWLLALGLRLALSQMDRVVWGDEPFYLWLGRNWITGQGFQFMGEADVHHGPLLPLLAGLLYPLTGDMALASEILYTAFGSLLVLPVYALGVEIYDRRAGLVAAVLTAVFPALTVATLHWGTMTEPLYMFWVYLGLWMSLRALRPVWAVWRARRARVARASDGDPWWTYALAGLSFGLAYLTRPEAIGYLAVVGVFFVVARWLAGSWRERRFWLMLLVYGLAFGLAFVPYAYYVRLQTGAWMVSEKVGVAYLTGIGLAHGDTAAFDRATWGLDSTGLETFFFSSESHRVSMMQLILDDPRTFAVIVYLNLQTFVRVLIDWTLLPMVLLPFVVLGLFDRGWTRTRTLKELLLVLSLAPVASFVLFFIQARYLVAAMPVFILWIAHGLLTFSDWLVGTVVELRSERRPAAGGQRAYWHMPIGMRRLWDVLPVLAVVILLLAVHPRVQREVTSVGSVRAAHREVGEQLRPGLEEGAVIMCRYPAIAFHAGATWVPTPNAPLDEVLEYARHKRADYVAIDERELRYRPQLKGLVTGEQVPETLERVLLDESGGERLVVYRLRGAD